MNCHLCGEPVPQISRSALITHGWMFYETDAPVCPACAEDMEDEE